MRKVIIDPESLIAVLEAYANPSNWKDLKMYEGGGVDIYPVCRVGRSLAHDALQKLKKEAGL